MDEKKFIKLLKSKKNKDGIRTPFIIADLLIEPTKEMVVYKKSIFTRFFGKRQQKKSTEQIIIDNFELILQKIDWRRFTIPYFRKLLREEMLQPFLKTRLIDIIKSIKRDEQKKEGCMQVNTAMMLQEYFDFFKDDVEFLTKYGKSIIDEADEIELFDVVQVFKGRNTELDAYINQVMQKKKIEIARSMIVRGLNYNNMSFMSPFSEQDEHTDQIISDCAETLSIMVEELINDENLNWTDLKRLGVGSFSEVYKIGEKILKIGIPRRTYKIPYCRRIIQPLVRTNFSDGENDVICIEISQEAERIHDEHKYGVNDILYRIYSELRRQGIMWTDPKPGNVGKLKSDNFVTLHGEPIEVDDAAVGLEGDRSGEVLKKGEYVIIDTDFIYREDDPEIRFGNYELQMEFERRYQNDRQAEIAYEYRHREREKSLAKREDKTEENCIDNHEEEK